MKLLYDKAIQKGAFHWELPFKRNIDRKCDIWERAEESRSLMPFFNIDVELDGFKNLQNTPLRFYFLKSFQILLKHTGINDELLINNFGNFA